MHSVYIMLKKIQKPSKSTLIKAFLLTVIAAVGTLFVFRSFGATGAITMATSSSTLKQGDTFNVTVSAATGSEPTTIAQAYITYDPTVLEYVSSDYAGTSFSTNSPEAGQGSGYFVMSRANLDNPASAPSGNLTIGTLTFKILAAEGTATIGIDQSKSALYSRNDGKDFLTDATGSSVSITPKQTGGDQTATGRLELTIDKTSVVQNNTFEVTLTAKSTANMTLVSAFLNFESSKVSYVSTNYTGSPLAQSPRNPDPGVESNRLIIERFKVPPGVAGDVVIGKFTFKATASSGVASFAINQADSALYTDAGSANILTGTTGTGIALTAPTTGGGTTTPKPPTTTPKPTPKPVTKPTIPKGEAVKPAPISTTSDGKKVVKTDYYLNNQYAGTATSPDDQVSIPTENLVPGDYQITAKSQAEDGSTEESSQSFTIAPPSFVVKYRTPIVLSAASILAIVGFLVVRFVFSKAAPFYKTIG